MDVETLKAKVMQPLLALKQAGEEITPAKIMTAINDVVKTITAVSGAVAAPSAATIGLAAKQLWDDYQFAKGFFKTSNRVNSDAERQPNSNDFISAHAHHRYGWSGDHWQGFDHMMGYGAETHHIVHAAHGYDHAYDYGLGVGHHALGYGHELGYGHHLAYGDVHHVHHAVHTYDRPVKDWDLPTGHTAYDTHYDDGNAHPHNYHRQTAYEYNPEWDHHVDPGVHVNPDWAGHHGYAPYHYHYGHESEVHQIVHHQN